MVDLQQRQKQIVKFLMNTGEYQPVKNIAEYLSCSTKTVRNDLNIIEERGIAIEKIPGKGIRISLNNEDRMNLSLIINKNNNNLNNISSESRRIKILFDLLDNTEKTISIQTLSQRYFISKTSIVNDLNNIEEKIAPYNLHLEKSIQGTKIIGSEVDIRKAMVNLLNELILSNEKLINLEDSKRINNITLQELSRQFSEENVKYLEEIIEEVEKLLDYKIVEPYYINLITHSLILINRTKNGRTIDDMERIDDIYISNETVYMASREMARLIEKYFSITLKMEEVYFIYRYLVSSGAKVPYKNALPAKLVSQDDLKASNMAKEMIKLCSELFQIDFTFNNQLYNDLILHLRPMLNRINYGILIKNQLIEEIKEELPEIMVLLKIIMLKICKDFELINISEDEIGYIAVYFQVAIEETISKKRVIIVCSTGIGTSHLLKNRIINYFPNWTIVDVIPANYLERKTDLSDIDLIISTVKIKNNENLNKPIAYVKALFNKSDFKIIRELLLKEKITKENKCKFNIICEFLKIEYIGIFNRIKYTDKELISVTVKKIFSENDNGNFTQQIKLDNNFIIYLYEKSYLIKPRIGINIIKSSKEESKIQLILALNKVDHIPKELIVELYKLFSQKEMLERLYKCDTCEEILKQFIWS